MPDSFRLPGYLYLSAQLAFEEKRLADTKNGHLAMLVEHLLRQAWRQHSYSRWQMSGRTDAVQ